MSCMSHTSTGKYAYHVDHVGKGNERAFRFHLRDGREATVRFLAHEKLHALAKAVTDASKDYFHQITRDDWGVTSVLTTTVKRKQVHFVYEHCDCSQLLLCFAEGGHIEKTLKAAVAVAYEGNIYPTRIWVYNTPQTQKLVPNKTAQYLMAAVKNNSEPWTEALLDSLEKI